MKTANGIKVCAWTLYPYYDAPGQRFRIEQWEPFLKSQGIEIDYFSFADKELQAIMPAKGRFFSKVVALAKGFCRRFLHLFKLKKYDAVFIYRAATMVGPAFFERIISFLGYPIILDFDDSIFLTHTAETNRFFGWAKCAGKTSTLCKLSTVVTVGNSFLSEYARRYNRNVFVVPTSLDISVYKPLLGRRRDDGQRVVVGWTGSSTSQTHLEAFESVLEELLKVRDVEIRVISNREPAFTRIPFTWRPWNLATEIEEISEFDIGIMPLPDDDWSRGKCSFKALQCMSLGIPTVCSDVGANREVVDHDLNGFLAVTPADWIEYLTRFIDNADLRDKMGAQARNKVVSGYSLERSAALFAEAIIRAIDIRRNES